MTSNDTIYLDNDDKVTFTHHADGSVSVEWLDAVSYLRHFKLNKYDKKKFARELAGDDDV